MKSYIDISPAVQEAIANIHKHAQPKRIRLILQSDKDSIFLRVQDRGKGFDLGEKVNEKGRLGLKSMQERAQMLGCTFQILIVKSKGTTIRCFYSNNSLDREECECQRMK